MSIPWKNTAMAKRRSLAVADTPVGETADELFDLGIASAGTRRAWRG